MNVEEARYNMVESQIRTWEVLDQRVLDLLFTLKREEFVPPEYRDLAFADLEIPLGFGEVMLAPKLEARIIQELTIQPTDRVLEVGSGSGYMTALLARFAAQICSVEIVPELYEMAKRNLAPNAGASVTLERGDASHGWAAHAPYDVIVLTGSTPLLPHVLLESLRPGGRLFAVVGDAPVMEGVLWTCVAAGAFQSVNLFETCIAPLRNAERPNRFKF
jgi:protein-L-isoaspartate(D-aspartate) O-methyltransferase